MWFLYSFSGVGEPIILFEESICTFLFLAWILRLEKGTREVE